MSWRAYLTYGDTTVTIGAGDVREGINATAEGIEGWYSTPESKWSLTERSYADGAYAIDEEYIVYATRIITLNLYVEGSNRTTRIENHLLLLGAAHHVCTLRVVDDEYDTYVEGYATVEDGAGQVSKSRDEVTLTLECPDARRLSNAYDSCYLQPSSSGITGGLYYGEDAAGLVYDLTYGTEDEEAGNIGTLCNGGSATAYPVVTVYGTFEDGFTLYMVTGGSRYEVSYSAYVTGVPVILDYRLRTAAVSGLDRSRYLTARGFNGIAPGSSATFNLVASGSGYAYAEVRDTYV